MNKHTMPIVRAVGVIAVTVALMSGVTFAALNSTATLTSSTISTASASLLVWNGSSFVSSAPGFTVSNLVPGTPESFPFYFQNNGGVPLAITANVPVTPTSSGFSDWNSVKVAITDDSTSDVQNTTLGALLAGQVTLLGAGSNLPAGAQGNASVANTVGNFHISFDIDPTSITGSQATVGPFDINFTGTQPTTP